MRFITFIYGCLAGVVSFNATLANDFENMAAPSATAVPIQTKTMKPQATPNHDPVRVSFYNNQTVTVPLSLVDANRLYIENDQIKDIGCMRGFCVSKEFDTGDAIIKLGEAAQFAKGGFTVFLSTQKGRKLALQVLPKAIPGQVVAFNALSGGMRNRDKPQDKHNSPYQETLIEFMKAMINQHQSPHQEAVNDHPILSDYGKVEIPDATPEKLNSTVTIVPIRLFQGERLMGVVYRVKNESSNTVPLTGAQFYKSGLLALALSQETLAPQSTAIVYQIQGA